MLYLCDSVPHCETLLPHLPLSSRILVTQDPTKMAYAAREQIRVVAPQDLVLLLEKK